MNGTLEIEMLEDIDLDAAPHCDARILNGPGPYVTCPQPSVARIISFCPDHGTFYRFCCAGHLLEMKNGTVRCGHGAERGFQYICMNVAVYRGNT